MLSGHAQPLTLSVARRVCALNCLNVRTIVIYIA